MKHCCKGHGYHHIPKQHRRHVNHARVHDCCSAHTQQVDSRSPRGDYGQSSGSPDNDGGGEGDPAEPVSSDVYRVRLYIEQMDCPTEETLIRKKLSSIPGILSLSFNLFQRILIVDLGPNSGVLPGVLQALRDLNMPGHILQDHHDQNTTVHKNIITHKPIKYLLFGGFFAIGAELWSLLSPQGPHHVWPSLVAALISLVWLGPPIFKKGWVAIKNKTLNIYFLMVLAVIGALIIGEWPEAAMVVFLFALAEHIESMALIRAKKAIESLNELAPEEAWIWQNNIWQKVKPEQIKIGTRVRVRSGERVPLDGSILEGTSHVDQSPITGESKPIIKKINDKLFAGSIVNDGTLVFEATALVQDGTLAKMAQMVQEAQSQRAPTQRFVDRFAAIYTPFVVLCAVLLGMWNAYITTMPWQEAWYQALVFLVIACPCALVISTPVTVVSGLARAAKMGLLVKGGVHLERGARLRTLAFDKTGTLTTGKLEVQDIWSSPDFSGPIWRFATSLSQNSAHPVSQAIFQAWHSSFPEDALDDVHNMVSVPGYGIYGDINGITYYLGALRWLSTFDLDIPTALLDQQHDTSVSVLFTKESGVLGAVMLADTVRPEARNSIGTLKKLGVHCVMLTGDHMPVAKKVAAEVDVDDMYAELLPENKKNLIEQYHKNKPYVGMIGDGINDAPALAMADIGFAMGAAGTATALETADVAVMDDDLSRLVDFINISQATVCVLKQNIALALGIKLVFFVLALRGEASLRMAVFADMGASLLVVFNGLRLLKIRLTQKPKTGTMQAEAQNH